MSTGVSTTSNSGALYIGSGPSSSFKGGAIYVSVGSGGSGTGDKISRKPYC